MNTDRAPFHYRKPAPLSDCVSQYEHNLLLPPSQQVPVGRVFILGAGFSAAFGFTTSADIVRGMMEYFSRGAPSYYQRHYNQVRQWLDLMYPPWRETPPHLVDVVQYFFSPGHVMPNRGQELDPLALYQEGLSWERENIYHMAVKAIPALPKYENIMLSFEALLCTYLFGGLMTHEVQQNWAMTFFSSLTSSDVILTFNWDVIPEVLLTSCGIPFSRYEWRDDMLKLVKLHGSIDLLGMPNQQMEQDSKEETIIPRFEKISPLVWRAVTAEGILPRSSSAPPPFGREIWPWERYNKSAVLIMPPYYTLGYGYEVIQFNWRKAKTSLEQTREIHIVGYSLTEDDFGFTSLVNGVVPSWKEQVVVHVWNPDQLVGKRAQQLFGTERVQFHSDTAAKMALSLSKNQC